MTLTELDYQQLYHATQFIWAFGIDPEPPGETLLEALSLTWSERFNEPFELPEPSFAGEGPAFLYTFSEGRCVFVTPNKHPFIELRLVPPRSLTQ